LRHARLDAGHGDRQGILGQRSGLSGIEAELARLLVHGSGNHRGHVGSRCPRVENVDPGSSCREIRRDEHRRDSGIRQSTCGLSHPRVVAIREGDAHASVGRLPEPTLPQTVRCHRRAQT